MYNHDHSIMWHATIIALIKIVKMIFKNQNIFQYIMYIDRLFLNIFLIFIFYLKYVHVHIVV